MTASDWRAARQAAIHLLRSGCSPVEVARRMGRPVSWVCKWQARYEQEGWGGLEDHSRAPRRVPHAHAESVRQVIRHVRSELEAEAYAERGLHYIGAHAILAHLQEQQARGAYTEALPSTATIERVLHAAEMTHSRRKREAPLHYPHLRPGAPLELIQVDIVPHYLPGGQAVSCFNAIDVVSRCPAGQAYAHRDSQQACAFLVYTWQTLGLPHYTQVDNEACFSGGFTHPGVLGKVVRLALCVGTELVFSPFHHPASNGTVERFHQDYDEHVWKHTHLTDLDSVQQQAQPFFHDYQHSAHHSALQGRRPAEVHAQVQPTLLAAGFTWPEKKQPLTEGRVHFIRRVQENGAVTVLNLQWSVPDSEHTPTVWVTLELAVTGATLQIYDAAPDAESRTCLVSYDFPLKEPVLSRPVPTTATQAASAIEQATHAPQPAQEPDQDSMVPAQAVSEEQMPVTMELSSLEGANPGRGPQVRGLPASQVFIALILSLVREATRLARRTYFTMW